MKTYDIIVVGGGFSGISAAISASRTGSKVLLIEKSGALGGAANNCLIYPFMPNRTTITAADGAKNRLDLTQGVFKLICDKLSEMKGLRDCYFNNDYLKVILDRLAKENGVDVLFHTTLTGVQVNEQSIVSVEVSTVAGKMQFAAGCFIDATGDANLAFLSGCRFRLGRESDSLCQPMTLCFRVSGLDIDEYRTRYHEVQQLYKQFQKEGKIKNPREDILAFDLTHGDLHFNTTRIVKLNPTDPFELSIAEAEAREQMLEIFSFLKDNFSCFKEAEISSVAASIGIRESRMVEGEHLLTGKELIAATKFDDAVAAGNYDIDIHNPEGTGTSHYYFPEGVYYTIPYRSLVAKDVKNLLVAGRCISCDHEAQASIRIMPICCSTGEAAGTAAAISLKENASPKDVNISELQAVLKRNGAFF